MKSLLNLALHVSALLFFASSNFNVGIAAQSIKLADISLNTTDTLGLVKVTGNISAELDSRTLEVDQIISSLKVKTGGIGFMEDFISSFSVVYKRPIELIHGSDIALPGFNQFKTLTEVVINEPKVISNNKREYSFNLNYLKAFGQGASSECQKKDSLNFIMVQQNKILSLYHKDLKNTPITSVKLYIETLGPQKRLSHIEVIASKVKKKFSYDSKCNKLN
jgi:hypothetical protein